MAKGYCPNCGSEIKLGSSPTIGQIVHCWSCKSRLKIDEEKPSGSEPVRRYVKFKRIRIGVTR
jgi:hypothetical protein